MLRALLLLLGSLLAFGAAHLNDGECVWPSDCEARTCFADATCVDNTCLYEERLPVSECCLTNDECCEYAAPHQTGACINNECTFSTSLQCVGDGDCEQLTSALVCRSQGECFLPYCEAGLCLCLNGTGLDLDQDGVACPDDCDDLDATITTALTCVRDADGDHYPTCVDVECMTFCVEPNRTCPHGYTDIDDPLRFSRTRSQRQDTGVPCASVPTIPEDMCDCCEHDKRAHPNSLYSASTVNGCGDADYDCNYISEQHACCLDGQLDAYSLTPRYLWFTSQCLTEAASSECGGCSTEFSAAVFFGGFACESECTGDEPTDVAPGMCPNACHDECACVDADTLPLLGQCAKLVTECIEVRTSPVLYADYETCCAVAVH